MQLKEHGDVKLDQGHQTTVFWEISVRSPLEWLKYLRAQEQLKISKMLDSQKEIISSNSLTETLQSVHFNSFKDKAYRLRVI